MLHRANRNAWRSRRKILLPLFGLGFVAAALLASYFTAVVYVPRTEPYRIAEKYIRSSSEISKAVGRITGLEVLSGSASHPWWSSSNWTRAYLRIRVTGTTGKAVVALTFVKAGEGWKIDDARLGEWDSVRKLNLEGATTL